MDKIGVGLGVEAVLLGEFLQEYVILALGNFCHLE